jgi:probable F420-dependent oxidoreductase
MGSQIEPHITRRFSMPWSRPAARMRELIAALHAIWDSWYEGRKLDFRGEFYTHTLMTPYFVPTDRKYGRPRVMLAAVGPEMTRVAAEVCDGMLCHSFTTPKYMREVTVPTVEKALADRGRDRRQFEIVSSLMMAMGDTDEEIAKGIQAVRDSIAFYGSTPAYKGVFEAHGLDDLQPRLTKLSKEGKWQEMGQLITEDMIREFAVVGTPEEVVRKHKELLGGKVDRTTFYPGNLDKERVRTLIQELGAA